ncbi:uncharacterized protein GGS22DRAFT_196179 [Annulohypoxylon maeteangense]|uniref:uncharacterized protein n=1 Tax=Annulohypoxylon maeteangense TaxID=1927788 RepID=UPI0020075B8B|nr:uncharacterized protein GGS22DRAFT_196179 [Annulohypoxylon maeteangense]KAI0882026.1 hypothetical protein GGS22DRAFT_196179 [Annulohypoxylon maeteangense]
MRLNSLIPGATALAFATPLIAAPTYSNATTVSQFVSQLDLSQQDAKDVTAVFGSYQTSEQIASLDEKTRATMACSVSQIVFSSIYLNATSTNYQDRIDVNWSDACWLDAQCIVQPTAAADVAKALFIISFMDTRFAVRSGGHNPNPEFASVGDNGILIDNVNLNEITLIEDGAVARVGPGNRFGAVLKTLSEENKTVVGGRIEDVGVGGYYLGGGMAYFSSEYGLAADGIRNIEIVLANSSIVNANATSNSDLFWALKGGGANFGVVTRYDINTIPVAEIWFEALLYDPSESEKLLEAVVEYAAAAENDTAAGLVFNLTPDAGLVGFIYGKPVERPSVYKSFDGIPSNGVYVNSTIGTWLDLADGFANTTSLTASRYMIVSIAHKWNLPTFQDSYQTYLNLSAQVMKEFNATLAYGVQPYTSAAVKHSAKTGGNPLGLEPIGQNWFTSTIQWQDESNDEQALAAIQALGDSVISASKKHGADLPFRFMNDANHAQNVLASYGSANLERLRSISKQYDPQQMFQNLQNGGFLLSKA